MSTVQLQTTGSTSERFTAGLASRLLLTAVGGDLAAKEASK